VGYFYNGVLWGNFSFFVGSNWNFVPGDIKKHWHTSLKFQLEIRNNKKVIAKKHLTNLYEMNSSVIDTREIAAILISWNIERRQKIEQRVKHAIFYEMIKNACWYSHSPAFIWILHVKYLMSWSERLQKGFWSGFSLFD